MEPVLEVRRGFVLAAVRRHLRLLAVGAVLGLVAGLGAAQVLGGGFTSQATILLNAQEGNPYSPTSGTSRTDQLAALETEASILRTPAVAELAGTSEDLGEDPLARVATSVPTNTQVIVITFTSTGAEQAVAGAQSFADAYLEYRTQRARAAADADVDRLQAQLDTAQASFDQVVADLAAQPDGVNRTLLQQQSQVYATQIAQVKGQIAQASSEAPSPGTVITPATTAEAQGLPPWLLAAAGLAGGLSLALLLAVGLTIRDDRVHPDRRREVTGLGPLLATVHGDAGDADLRNAHHAVAGTSGYQSVLATIRAQLPQHGGTVALVGAGPDVDVDVVAAGLASTSHRAGLRVLLLTLDDGDGTGAPGWPSPRRTLTGAGPTAPDLDHVDRVADRLGVVGGGAVEDVSDVLASERGQRFVSGAADTHDLVILAGGHIAEPVAQHCGSIARCSVVVARSEHTTWTQMGQAADLLGQVGADAVGYVLTRPRRDLPVPTASATDLPQARTSSPHDHATAPEGDAATALDADEDGSTTTEAPTDQPTDPPTDEPRTPHPVPTSTRTVLPGGARQRPAEARPTRPPTPRPGPRPKPARSGGHDR